MKLGRKNLSYSLLLAGILLLFLTCYFIYMLPSLYVDYLTDENLRSIRQQHQTYVETGSYETAQVRNPTACLSIRIPDQGDTIYLTGKAFSAQITLTDARLREQLSNCQRLLSKGWPADISLSEDKLADMDQILSQWKDIFQSSLKDQPALPVDIALLPNSTAEIEYANEKLNYHLISDQLIIIETGVEDANNSYTTYFAIEKTDDALVVSLLPVITPDINEIRPVVLQSLPVLAAVVLLLVLLFSQFYSKGIINPMEVEITKSYRQLEEKNQALSEENKRQEIFLRASSHQLKTPISAALLLVEGMISRVGKYQDTAIYLPKVKSQLLSMRKMVEDILYQNRLKNQVLLQEIEISLLLRQRLLLCQVTAEEKNLSVHCEPEHCGKVLTDERMASLIFDNLLSNAIDYTPCGEKIEINSSPGTITIRNYGVRIPEELLPHIFDPFVSGNHGTGGHGLGLYIASSYAPTAKMSIAICNDGNSVMTRLTFLETR